ncbi:MAG: translation elongation factor 4 [Mycoplasmataceae bacterium]|jgi:GTP-binding protein LepA|nr:translation elongation factor 4 [Mycoplasmataceae bacterium]
MEKKIRNFCIIAHIDHGKSTLSDRIIELTNGVEKREMKEQILDSMEIERERGITIKLNAVQLKYKDYLFHLIDTPGHVDFSYEVNRSLAACDGALLVVDATQGVQAQTLSNVFMALENNLFIIPVINKIDLPNSDVEKAKRQITEKVGINANNAICVSAKTGHNVDKLLDLIIAQIPPPWGKKEKPLRCLIFDSFYERHKGVVCLIRVFDGVIKVGMKIRMMHAKKDYIVSELGIRTPKNINREELSSGEVGWVCANIKKSSEVNIGETITNASLPQATQLPGYKKILPMVYSGIYPVDNGDFDKLKDAMEKITLTDASLSYEFENSLALGNGIRCGFLGLLHLDVIKERIFKEYNLDVILTMPSVVYEITLTNNEVIKIDNPSKYPEVTRIREIKEPIVKLTIITPEEYIGPIIDFTKLFRSEFIKMNSIDSDRMEIIFNAPLAEIISSFFDTIKSISKGYATIDYDIIGYKKSDLVKVDILLNGEKVDALSFISDRNFAQKKAREIVERVKEFVPRQQFECPIQASIGGKIIARETIKAYRKNVLAKCYGGDITRQMKLLQAQKIGKKKLKAIGKVNLSSDVFVNILKKG